MTPPPASRDITLAELAVRVGRNHPKLTAAAAVQAAALFLTGGLRFSLLTAPPLPFDPMEHSSSYAEALAYFGGCALRQEQRL
jgi:hypothetical protein